MYTGNTWIVAADAGIVKVFERVRPGGDVVELAGREMKAEPPPAPRARAPRVHDRMGSARHAIEKRVAPRDAAEIHFLERAAQRLNDLAEAGAYDSLVLCAPPRAAGFLKAHLSKEAVKRLKNVVLKDLTHERAEQIAARLESGFA